MCMPRAKEPMAGVSLHRTKLCAALCGRRPACGAALASLYSAPGIQAVKQSRVGEGPVIVEARTRIPTCSLVPGFPLAVVYPAPLLAQPS